MATCSSILHSWVFILGILGNIVSFMVYLAPVPTFCRIYKKKSTERFHSFPYLITLFSSMLWIYYAILKSKSNAYLLISVNSVGCAMETIYIALYIAFAPKKARMMTLKLLLLFNFGGFLLIALLSYLLANGSKRVEVLGWICLVVSASVFAAPMSVTRQVIRTKSVEFMPFWLSFFLTLNAIMWFFYGFLQKDYYIAVPNILGFVFGILQMVLHRIYKNNKVETPQEQKLPTLAKEGTRRTAGDHPVCSLPNFCTENLEGKDENLHDLSNHVLEGKNSIDAPNQV